MNKLKISVLTATFNREKMLEQLYESLVKNSIYNSDIEWLIMDDGSEDRTKDIVEKFEKENKIDIKYYYQENQGKMVAINNIIDKATGDLIIECGKEE